MTELLNRGINICAVTSRTIVSGITILGTSWSGNYGDVVVAKSGSGNCLIVISTVLTRIGYRTLACTGGSYVYCAFVVVIVTGKYNGLAAELGLTNGTVNYFIIRAVGLTTFLCVVLNLYCACDMIERGSDLSATYGTGLSLGTVCLGTVGVTLSRIYNLSNENLVTYGAVLTFGKTIIGTGGSNSFVNNFGVRLSRDYLLSNGNFVTYGAVLTFGKTCRSTSSFYGCILHLGVTLSGNHVGISADLVVTNGTVDYAVVRTCVLTIGVLIVLSLRCACGVRLSRGCGLSNENLVTYGAVLTFGKTCRSTSSFYGCILHLGVTESRLFYIA